MSLMLLPFSILDTNKAVGQGRASPAGPPAARLAPHSSGSRLQTLLDSVLNLFRSCQKKFLQKLDKLPCG